MFSSRQSQNCSASSAESFWQFSFPADEVWHRASAQIPSVIVCPSVPSTNDINPELHKVRVIGVLMWLLALFPKQPACSTPTEDGQSCRRAVSTNLLAFTLYRKVTSGNQPLKAIRILIAIILCCNTLCDVRMCWPHLLPMFNSPGHSVPFRYTYSSAVL